VEVNIGSGKVNIMARQTRILIWGKRILVRRKTQFGLTENGFCLVKGYLVSAKTDFASEKVNCILARKSILVFRKTDFAWAILILRVVISLGKRSFVLGENGFWFEGVQIFGWANGGFDFANDNSYGRK